MNVRLQRRYSVFLHLLSRFSAIFFVYYPFLVNFFVTLADLRLLFAKYSYNKHEDPCKSSAAITHLKLFIRSLPLPSLGASSIVHIIHSSFNNPLQESWTMVERREMSKALWYMHCHELESIVYPSILLSSFHLHNQFHVQHNAWQIFYLILPPAFSCTSIYVITSDHTQSVHCMAWSWTNFFQWSSLNILYWGCIFYCQAFSDLRPWLHSRLSWQPFLDSTLVEPCG